MVQVYLRRPSDKEGPVKTLRAFRRVTLKKGETKNVEFKLDGKSFEWYDTQSNTVRPVSGEYEIMYGGTSDSKALKTVKVSLK